MSDDDLTYGDAERIALRAIHGEDGRGMIGSNRRHLHQRVARAILSVERDTRRIILERLAEQEDSTSE